MNRRQQQHGGQRSSPTVSASREDTVAKNTTSPQRERHAAKNIHINIHLNARPKLPAFKTIRIFFRRLFSTKRAVITGCIALITLLGVSVAASSVHQQNIAKKSSGGDSQNRILENLEYQTVLPEGKSIDTLGGWKRVSPPNSTAVYAYTDAIDGIGISVVQQPLPQNFKDDADGQVANLAKKSDGYSQIDAGGTKAYLGTSAKGPQSVILTKNGLLIIIKSQNKIDPASWAKYIKSLN